MEEATYTRSRLRQLLGKPAGRMCFVLLPVFILAGSASEAFAKPLETDYFSIDAESSRLDGRQVEQIGGRLDKAFEDVSGFLGFVYDLEKKGKIKVEFRPGAGVSGTTPDLRITFNARVAALGRVLVHEVTHIVTGRHRDFFIRHLDAPYMEEKFGSIQSAPSCGYSVDLWSAAYLSAGKLVPSDRISSDSLDWGYTINRSTKVTSISDPHRHQLYYTTAGSFGKYLIEKYGAPLFKKFHARGSRAWDEVYGKSIEALEGEWRETLKAMVEKEGDTVKRLVSLQNDSSPCLAALRVKP